MTYVKTYLPTLKTHVVNLKSDAKDLSRDLQRLEVPQATQAHYVWVRAPEVIWSEYTRIISGLSDAKQMQKILKIWILLVCLSILVAFKITKVEDNEVHSVSYGRFKRRLVDFVSIEYWTL